MVVKHLGNILYTSVLLFIQEIHQVLTVVLEVNLHQIGSL